MATIPLAASELPPVTSVIPHREPFLLVDSVTELRDGYVAAVRTFHPDEPFFAGHFPGQPVVPGVLLIEGLAQTMAYYALFQKSASRVFLVGIDRARFHSIVGPATQVTFEVEMGEQRFGILTGRGRVRVGNRKVAEATLKGFAGDPPKAPR
jgi:3-hydroxymyristoyl/3-hydroxydecanoyl-(acyl carrier protein) dehydratase